jgi:hypothetical protein
MSVISDLEAALAAAKAEEAAKVADVVPATDEKSESGLCKNCAQFLTPNGVEWQNLCPKCAKKFVS